MSSDHAQNIQQQIEQALSAQQSMSIHGGGSHDFMLPDYREPLSIDMRQHHGVIDYQPSELTVKVRAGTTLQQLSQVLAEGKQRLPTDIPAYSDDATIGGALAIGHSGSGRPFLGALRDHVLGVGMLNGHGKLLNCGGQVMKNVAGYDVSRLLVGSRGTLGLILDITFKVLPIPEMQHSLVFEMAENQAIEAMNRLAGRSLPISAAAFVEGRLVLRLEGTSSGIAQACEKLGGETLTDGEAFWQQIQQQRHAFFTDQQPLWRIVVPSATPRLELENEHRSLTDWCGGLRWIHSEQITQSDFIHVSNVGGYIEQHRGGQPSPPTSLMSKLQKQMHHRLKLAFDPDNRFNPALSHFK